MGQTATPPVLKLVLASASPYRRSLLEGMGLRFEVDPARIDETPRRDESPSDLVRRLSRTKARAVTPRHPHSLVIGSDQIAVLDASIIGKPGTFDANVEQLTRARGREVQFLTGLCLINSQTGREQLDAVAFTVKFRRLSSSQIRAYVRRERPFECAGGFRSEGLGIALFEWMAGSDPSALIGLPLIRLSDMLLTEGWDVLCAE